MQTFLGKPFNLVDPREEDVDPNDLTRPCSIGRRR
jgi:hypothetical protein